MFRLGGSQEGGTGELSRINLMMLCCCEAVFDPVPDQCHILAHVVLSRSLGFLGSVLHMCTADPK